MKHDNSEGSAVALPMAELGDAQLSATSSSVKITTTIESHQHALKDTLRQIADLEAAEVKIAVENSEEAFFENDARIRRLRLLIKHAESAIKGLTVNLRQAKRREALVCLTERATRMDQLGQEFRRRWQEYAAHATAIAEILSIESRWWDVSSEQDGGIREFNRQFPDENVSAVEIVRAPMPFAIVTGNSSAAYGRERFGETVFLPSPDGNGIPGVRGVLNLAKNGTSPIWQSEFIRCALIEIK